jgi:large subunit ribosomal protein L21
MRYAIVESGGKQYKAVEGEAIEVDRLPVNAGDKVGLERVLMLVDGDDVTVGTPTIGDLLVNTTVVDHVKGPKITVFKYSPKKRIRVKTGHRQQYTRLMVDAIGKPEQTRKPAKAEKKTEE